MVFIAKYLLRNVQNLQYNLREKCFPSIITAKCFCRYNSLTVTPINGNRLIQQRPSNKYSSPPISPVNLTQHKEDVTEDLSYTYSRLFAPPFTPYHHHNPYQNVYHPSYASLLRTNYAPPPLSPLDSYCSTTTATVTKPGTFLTPPATYSPPSGLKLVQSLPRDRKPPTSSTCVPSATVTSATSFKVPTGKEGSLKHRILTRPEDTQRCVIDLQTKLPESGHKPSEASPRRRVVASVVSPPRSPSAKHLNNNTVPVNFTRGSLIQLANGELRKVEDMRTEDFVSSAEANQELRLTDSTVVKIGENPITGTVAITLTYNQRRTQVSC